MIRPSTAALLFLAATALRAEPVVEFTHYLGPLTGEGAELHPDNVTPHRIEYYGTDLGWSYAHKGRIHFLFGDTWATEAYAPIESATGPRLDDGFGTIGLDEWPDPRQITPENMPRIRLGQHPGSGEMMAQDPGHAMDLGKTPMTGFSNGADEFAVFNLGKGLGCRTDADCTDGLRCDTELGYAGVPYTEEFGGTLPCLDGAPGCNADTMVDAKGEPVPGSGFCTDDTSSVGARPVSNLLGTLGWKVRIGVRDHEDPRKYHLVRDWYTNKFLNVTARTVESFTPGRNAPPPDWSPAAGGGEGRRVFLWGRPGFVGVNAHDRTLALYFAYVDLPAAPPYTWSPQYYAGEEDGVPRFSPDQRDAVPLDLDAKRPGVQAREAYDVVDQMSIVWAAPLGKWVMFYSGGMGKVPRQGLPVCGVLQLFTGAECEHVDVGNGAFRMRTADLPWGPWSEPQELIVAGDPRVPEKQYGPGGALRHPACKAPACAPHTDTPYYSDEEYGFFYAPNIIEQWMVPAPGGVEILWNASTWDPYRVILLRTRIRK